MRFSCGGKRKTGAYVELGGSIMFMAVEDPHWLCRASASETEPPVEIDCPPVSKQYLLVEASISRHEEAHETSSDTTPLVVWSDYHVWEVHHQVAVRDRVAKPNQKLRVPSGHECVGSQQPAVKGIRLGRR
jgi:hypothetical protein